MGTKLPMCAVEIVTEQVIDGAEVVECSLREFIRNNNLSRADLHEVVEAWRSGAAAFFGGGASGGFFVYPVEAP